MEEGRGISLGGEEERACEWIRGGETGIWIGRTQEAERIWDIPHCYW